MNTKFWKWWTVANLGFVLLGASQYYFGVAGILLEADSTYISFVIICVGILFFLGLLINYRAVEVKESENQFYWFLSDVVLSMGMVGTLVGFLMVLGQAFLDIDPSNIDSMTNAITVLATGMSTALVTTLCGLIVSVWMKMQLVIVESGS